MSRLLKLLHAKNFWRGYYKPMTVIYVFTPVLIASRLGLSELLAPNSTQAINLFSMRIYGTAFLVFYIALLATRKLKDKRFLIFVLAVGSCLYFTLGYDVWPILTSMTWNFICAFILFVEAGKVNDRHK